MKYTGKDLDEDTGLYYFNARWYDAETGRFISEDPARDGANWYVYVSNNPLKYTDPTGLAKEDRERRREERRKRREQRRQDRREYRERIKNASTRSERKLIRAERSAQFLSEARTAVGRRYHKQRLKEHIIGAAKSSAWENRNVDKSDWAAEGGAGPYSVTTQYWQGERPLQTDIMLNGWSYDVEGITDFTMNEFGCHFLSALGVAQTFTDQMLEPEQINFLRHASVAAGYMSPDLAVYTNYTPDIIDMALAMMGSAARVQDMTFDSKFLPGANASILKGISANGGRHFREGDGLGNSIWDPYSNDSDYIDGFSVRETRYIKIGYDSKKRALR